MLKLLARISIWLGVSVILGVGSLTWYNYNNFTMPRATVKMIVNSCGGSGSVVSITPDVVLTAGHLIKGVDLTKCNLTINGLTATKVLKVWNKEKEEPDLAVLLVPGLGCPCAPLGTMPEVDDKVIAIGYPLGRGSWVSRGYVQAVSEPGHLWTSTSIAPGNSGGGIFAWQGLKWKLVGITSGMLAFPINPFMTLPLMSKATNVDINTIRTFLSDLE